MGAPKTGAVERLVVSSARVFPLVGISGGLFGMTGEGMFADTVIVK